jgi:O-antigen/teichoic acid export membrane protein
MLATILFSGYFGEIIIILIGFVLAPEEVARFHVSFRLALLISFGLFAIDTATAPDLARHYAAGDFAAVDRVVKQATRLRIAGALLATGVFAVAGRWALSWFGPEFVAGYPLLLILACGQLVQSAVGPAARLMSISGHQDQALAVSAGALLLAIVLVILLVPRYGALGAAVAATLDLALWALTMRFMLRRSTGLKIRVF